jgi:DNA (cytosine-5)-methyltransferase 1
VKAISLFSGCGGDTLGLENAGFNVIGFVEFWKKAVETHKLNFPESEFIGEAMKGDITKIPDEEFLRFQGKIDVLFAGFPCQGFSHAGKKDPNDTRNNLFWEFVRVAKLIKPKWIIGENVSGLLKRKTKDGKTNSADIIVNAFKKIGYNMAEPTILNAEEYGVPQKRRRVFFVGNREGIDFSFPEKLNSKENPPTIRSLIEHTTKNSEKYDSEKVHEIEESSIVNYKSKRKNEGSPHPYLSLKLKEEKISFGRRISPHHVEMVNLDAPTKTIHCGYSFQPRLFVGLKNKEGFFLRDFTNKELAQIQSFPKEYLFSGNRLDIVKQIGNAVPPKLIEEIAKQILNLDSSINKQN